MQKVSKPLSRRHRAAVGNKGCRKPFSENSDSQTTTSNGPKRWENSRNSDIQASKLLVLFNPATFLLGNPQVVAKLNFDTEGSDLPKEVGVKQVWETMEYTEVVVCRSFILNIYEILTEWFSQYCIILQRKIHAKIFLLLHF